MKHAATQELFSYWNRLRGSRVAPERADIDPGAIRGVLADTFILELTADGALPMRISGARLSALFANELKGADFIRLWLENSQSPARELIVNVTCEQAPAIAGVKAAPAGRTPLDLELLLLPLRHFGKPHTRVLGCLAPASVPAWLGLLPVAGLELGPMRIMRSLVQPEAFQFSHNQKPAPAARHGHLRVHTGGITDKNDVLQRT